MSSKEIKKVSDYRVPSMREIKRIEKSHTVISTFSGAGGSSLGYKLAGLNVLWASEFVEAAQEVYRLNHPTTFLNTLDIRDVTPEQILLEANLKKGELDILDGSPPCAAFSSSGKRQAGWGDIKKYSDTSQRVDDLFFEYVRILKGLKPKVFIAENVKGLVSGVAKGYFKQIMRALKEAGYVVKAQVLDAKWLGVPQSRPRVIFMGVRNDLGLEPVFPKPHAQLVSYGDAVARDEKLAGLFWTLPEGKMTQMWHHANNYRGSFDKAHLSVYGKGSMFNHYRIQWDLPSRSAVQGSQSLYHPDEPRSLTIGELKRVCAFPDDFKLTGSFSKQWERLGRAVPPLMMREIAGGLKHVFS